MLKKIMIAFLAVFVLHSGAGIAGEPKQENKQPKTQVVSTSSPGEKAKTSTSDRGANAKVTSVSVSGKSETPSANDHPLMVIEVSRVLPPKSNANPRAAGLGDTIRVKVTDLKQFQDKARQDNKRIHLFLNGMEMKGIQPTSYNLEQNELEFTLLRMEELPAYADAPEQKKVWAILFGFRPRGNQKRLVEVSVGEENGESLPYTDKSKATLQLIRIRSGGVLIYLALIAVLVGVYWWAFKKGAFSDKGMLQEGEPALSLGRVQMGWWFFWVVAAFFFIWMVIGELPEIPSSVLALIGIASGTALGAAAIDASKRTRARAVVGELDADQSQISAIDGQIRTRQEELSNLKGEIDDLQKTNPQDPNINQKKQEYAELDKKISDLEAEKSGLQAQVIQLQANNPNAQSNMYAVKASSSGWLYDLLSDADGFSFHRLQMAIWTIVLSIVFIAEVAINLALPDFDPTLLALMGISSGTYIGFKFPEQQPNSQPQKPS